MVGDHGDAAELLVRLLQRAGYLAGAVGSPDDAIRAMGDGPPDLVVADLQEGGSQTNARLLKAVRAHAAPAVAAVPVLLVATGDSERPAATAARTDGFLVRPFRHEAFVDEVTAMLDPSAE